MQIMTFVPPLKNYDVHLIDSEFVKNIAIVVKNNSKANSLREVVRYRAYCK